MRQSLRRFDEAEARAVTWLTAWDSQGVHRTGPAGDEAGARWLADEAAGLGVEVASEAFTWIGLTRWPVTSSWMANAYRRCQCSTLLLPAPAA